MSWFGRRANVHNDSDRLVMASQSDRPRVALVIGISNYAVSKLPNAVKDAMDMAHMLEDKAGFHVTSLLDPTRQGLILALDKFAKSIQPDSIVLFYYAGHGMAHGGKNHMMLPEYESFMKSGADTTCSAAGYSMEEALSKITYAAERGAVIALLDTCRSNAAAACGGRTRGLGAACPKMDLEIAHPETTELLECFACSHENEAQDGSSGSNGLYTKHLLQHIFDRQYAHIVDAMEAVIKGVRAETFHGQRPVNQYTLMNPFKFPFVKPLPKSTPSPTAAHPTEPNTGAQASSSAGPFGLGLQGMFVFGKASQAPVSPTQGPTVTTVTGNRPKPAEDMSLSELVQAMDPSAVPAVRLSAIQELAQRAWDPVVDNMTICNQPGLIAAVTALLKDSTTCEHAAAAIRALADGSSDIISRLAQDGGIVPSLVTLLQGPPAVVKQAVAALACLAKQHAGSLQLLCTHATAARDIVAVLQSRDDAVRRQQGAALGLLGRMAAAKPELGAEITNTPEAVSSIAALLQHHDAAVRTSAAAMVGVLTHSSSKARSGFGQTTAVQFGLLQALSDDSADMPEIALVALRNILCDNPAMQNKVVSHAPAVKQLVALLKDANTDIRRMAAVNLARLAKLEGSAEKLQRVQGFIPAVVSLLQDPQPQMASTAARLIGCIAKQDESGADSERLLQQPAVLVGLVAQLTKPGPEAAVSALAELACRSSECQYKILRSGAVWANLLGQGDTCYPAAFALWQLSEEAPVEERENMARTEGLVRGLVYCLSNSKARGAAARALGCMATDSLRIKLLIMGEPAVVSGLAAMLRDEPTGRRAARVEGAGEQ